MLGESGAASKNDAEAARLEPPKPLPSDERKERQALSLADAQHRAAMTHEGAEAQEQEARIASAKLTRAKAEKDLADLRKPWWRSWNLAVVAGFLTTIAPTTTAVQGYFQKEREIALEKEKQTHTLAMERERQAETIRNAYLDRLRDPAERLRVLRFLIETSDQPKIVAWALAETKFAEKDIADASQRASAAEKEAEVALGKLAQERDPNVRKVLAADAERKISRAKDASTAATRFANMGGEGGLSLSAELEAARKQLDECLKAKDADPQACATKSSLLKQPSDADIAQIRSLEPRAAEPDVHVRLVDFRRMFLKGTP